MTTYVAYELKNEDYTGILVSKAGLFWNIQDPDTEEIRKVPAKAVTETWEESDTEEQETTGEPETVVEDEPVEETPEEPATQAAVPSLAAQASSGPTLADPGPTITLAELCEDQGIEPRIARRQLRAAAKAGTLEHTHNEGWIFQRDSIESIMKIITTKKRG